ncbi:MAG: hypothetical protein GX957_10640, partial [Clostridiaceae bacterium]|nr:hypothetical protein [Clostridiaceae bacterium]
MPYILLFFISILFLTYSLFNINSNDEISIRLEKLKKQTEPEQMNDELSKPLSDRIIKPLIDNIGKFLLNLA